MRWTLALLLFALPAFAWTPDPEKMHPATPEELAMKNVAFEPGAPAAVLEREHYQDDTDGYAKEYVRIKVFNDPKYRGAYYTHFKLELGVYVSKRDRKFKIES